VGIIIANLVVLFVLPVLFLVAIYFSWKRFWLLFSVNMSILILYAIVGGIGGYRPNFSFLLWFLYPYGAFLVLFNIVAILQFWEDYGLLTLLPLLVSILGFWLPGLVGDVGTYIRVKVFENRLDLYEAAVKELTPMIDVNGLDLRGEQVPQEYRKLTYRISAEKKDGIVFRFYWDESFIPSMRSWFIYRSDEFLAKKGADLKCEPPFCERINEHWFRVELR